MSNLLKNKRGGAGKNQSKCVRKFVGKLVTKLLVEILNIHYAIT